MKARILAVFALAVCLSCSLVFALADSAFAQAPPAAAEKPAAPTVAEKSAAKAPVVPVMPKIDSVTLENYLLKVELVRAPYEKAQAELNAFMAKIAKPGMVIQRGPEGFVYAVAPLTEPKPAPAPTKTPDKP